jgi:hypothetical protein
MSDRVIEIAGDLLACVGQLVLRAVSEGHKVVFLSRDGWLPWRLSGEAGPYLMVSRQALRIPLFAADPARAANWAIDPVTVNTVESVLARFLTSPQAFDRELHAAGFGESTWKLGLGRGGRLRLKGFIQSPAFTRHLEFLKEENQGPTMDYLSSNGVFDGAGVQVVDIGWNGSCQKHLQEYRAMAGADPASLGGIYLGLQTRAGFAKGSRLEAVWEPGSIGGHLFKLSSFYTLAEMILTADHGGVIGYERGQNRVSPILAAHDGNEDLNRWGLPQFHREILTRAEARLSDAAGDFDQFATQTAAGFERFAARPSPSEAARYGEWPACVDPAHQCAHALAPRMNLGDMWNYFIHRKPQPVLWREGAEARLDGLPRLAFRAANQMDLLASGMRRMVSQWRR